MGNDSNASLLVMVPLKIGLTGGIATGKTTVSDEFAKLGVPIFDADVLAHALVAPGQPLLTSILQSLGSDFLQADGHLNRAKLRQRVFADAEQRRRLEALLHPPIRHLMQAQAAHCECSYCILSIPLLLETQQMDLVDRILVVDCSPAKQRQRLQERNHFTDEEIQLILAAQAQREERLAIADDVIDNNGNLEELRQQVHTLHQKYLSISSIIS